MMVHTNPCRHGMCVLIRLCPYTAFAAISLVFAATTMAAQPQPAKMRVIIDADTANEVDDLFAIARALVAPEGAEAAPGRDSGLRVSDNHRFFVTAEGKPFFWLADTAWQLIHDLDREEVELYLTNRAAKGFNVVQTVVLAQYGGVDRPNAYGHLALLGPDPARPDVREGDDYWKHVDHVIRRAAQHGIYVALLPTWGSHVTKGYFDGKVNGIFTTENAETYGRFLGQRYREVSNIIWMLGGDRAAPTKEAQAIWRAMARGIAIGATGREDYSGLLMTFHPVGPGHSADYFPNEEWMDFNGIQSSHGPVIENWKMIERDYRRVPTKPVIDMETTYVEIVFGKETKPLTDDMARRAAYWAVFAGAAGHTYGHNSIWQMYAPGKSRRLGAKTPWREALDAPSARQMGHLRRLFESLPFTTLKPDLSLLAFEQTVPWEMCLALRGEGVALAYTPTGRTLDLNLDILATPAIQASWFDPRIGTSSAIGSLEARGRKTFDPPGAESPGNDWVLVVRETEP